MNRGTHGFNEGLDRFVLEPAAKGWDFVVPDPVETSVGNFFENVRLPVVLLNDILMLRPRQAGEDFGRLVLNSTLGVAGLFDPASRLEIPDNDADFGLTLARYYAPAGPYLVLPFFGPSTVRDTIGLLGDTLVYSAAGLPLFATVPARAVEAVNLRSIYMEEIAENRSTSLDYYVFLRNAYLQNRQSKIRQGRPDDSKEEDTYFYDEE